ncbi:S-adenosyl-L-methionine-dependent methyltransferase [Lecanosticta acicola]|uniref:S-adenosyl-L-methionine-dependent methyltransferase n=1 Tax=Lecanosticta acicola TaxID=111012 RepID=A0AAI9ECH9_9PEZI|nr:S-adenosyl-L-methionine-dependent methyltransferase [Lecanosticta acicola]
MSTDLKPSAWSATASTYNSRIVQVTSQGGSALLSLLTTLRPFTPHSKTLDSGCGSGALTALLHSQCPCMEITAGDIAPGMRDQLSKRNLPIQIIPLDSTKPLVPQNLSAESFTHAVTSFMLQFIPNAPFAIKEMQTILEPGGVVGNAIWSQNLIADPWNQACRNLDPHFKPNESAFDKALKTTEDLEEAYREAGFVDITSEETELYLTFESAEDFAEFFIHSGNPPFVMMMSTWKGNVEDVRQELVRVTREHFEDGKIFMVAACTVGRKPL